LATGRKISRTKFVILLVAELTRKIRVTSRPCLSQSKDDIEELEVATIEKKRQLCQVVKCSGNKTNVKYCQCRMFVCDKYTGNSMEICVYLVGIANE